MARKVKTRSITGTNDYNGMQWRPRVWGKALSLNDWRGIYEREKGWFG